MNLLVICILASLVLGQDDIYHIALIVPDDTPVPNHGILEQVILILGRCVLLTGQEGQLGAVRAG